MSKTNHASNLDHGALEDHRPLADSELDAVSGGWYFPGNTKYTAVKLSRSDGDRS
jgi:hypothetical protein